jgi:hypothetical protein
MALTGGQNGDFTVLSGIRDINRRPAMRTDKDRLDEINQRATRLESRLVQLGDYVGANLRTRMRIVVRSDGQDTWVDVDAFDVSISRIVTTLREQGIQKGMLVPVRLMGQLIATVVAT